MLARNQVPYLLKYLLFCYGSGIICEKDGETKMNFNRKSILRGIGIIFIFTLFSMIISGCTCFTLTAKDQLLDKIAMKSSRPVKLIYLEFSKPTRTKASLYWKGYWGDFESRLKYELKSKGYKLVSSSSDAELVAKLKIHYYMKKMGREYFFLGFISIGDRFIPPMEVPGIKVQVLYITDTGKWSKTYLAYQNIIRRDDLHPNIKVSAAIISDLNQLNK